MFFSFDGIDGVGKSTQIALFVNWLRAEGREFEQCRDPGTTAVGEAIREILLGQRAAGMALTTEMLLYMAARAQLVDQFIAPALQRGMIVVSDRFLLANVVYQGHAGGLDPAVVWQVGQIATRGITPDLIFVLDMDESAAAQRLNRPLDRMERRGDDFRARLRQGYLSEARRAPDRIAVIDADRDIDAIQLDIRQAALRLLEATDRRNG